MLARLHEFTKTINADSTIAFRTNGQSNFAQLLISLMLQVFCFLIGALAHSLIVGYLIAFEIYCFNWFSLLVG
jgi:hypothetical protein